MHELGGDPSLTDPCEASNLEPGIVGAGTTAANFAGVATDQHGSTTKLVITDLALNVKHEHEVHYQGTASLYFIKNKSSDARQLKSLALHVTKVKPVGGKTGPLDLVTAETATKSGIEPARRDGALTASSLAQPSRADGVLRSSF